MSGGLAWAIVEPSMKVTIECTIDCGCTTTSMRSYGMPNSRCVSMSSRPLLTSDAEFSVFIGPMTRSGGRRPVPGVTRLELGGRPAAERPAGGGQHQLGDLLGGAAAQALGQRGVFGVHRHDLTRPRRPQHQRTTGDQRFLVGQRQPGAGRQRGQGRSQAQRPDQRVEDDVGFGVLAPVGSPLRVRGRRRRRPVGGALVGDGDIGDPGLGALPQQQCPALPPPAARPTTSKRSGLAAMTSSACVPIEPVLPSTSTRRRPSGVAVVTHSLCPLGDDAGRAVAR